jgi:PPOX class probable F420-dependent enzyme
MENLKTNPSFSVIVDHYEEDWNKLWWLRVDGSGWVIEGGDERERALHLLADKYRQYRDIPPLGPVVALNIERWLMWP